METKIDRFLASLTAEKLQAQERRGALISRKLGWVAGLFALGALKLPEAVESRALLYFVPVVSLIYDLYILGENYGIKRMGSFVRQKLPACYEAEWESWLRSRRDRFSWYALPLSTGVILVACSIILLGDAQNIPSLVLWFASMVVLMLIVYVRSGIALRGLDTAKAKQPNKAPEPTTMAVTSRAPSSTRRASHGRGSS